MQNSNENNSVVSTANSSSSNQTTNPSLNSNNEQQQNPNVTNPPSVVVHIRNLDPSISQHDILTLSEQFGVVSHLIRLKPSQALLQFDQQSSSTAFVEAFSNTKPANLRGRNIYISYSSHKELTKGAISSPDPTEKPNNIILVSILNPHSNINVDFLYPTFSYYGKVQKIVIFNKSGPQALIQYENLDNAIKARNALEGHSLFNNSTSTFTITYSNFNNLTITKASDKSRDYVSPPTSSLVNSSNSTPTTPTPPVNFSDNSLDSVATNTTTNNNNVSNSIIENTNNSGSNNTTTTNPSSNSNNPIQSNNTATNQSTTDSNDSILPTPKLPVLPSSIQLATGKGSILNKSNPNKFNNLQVSTQPRPQNFFNASNNRVYNNNNASSPLSNSPQNNNNNFRNQQFSQQDKSVLIATNLSDQIDVNKLFNIFSCYGYVVRIKIFYTKRDHALVQMADENMANLALTNLKGIELYGKPLQIGYSKHTHIGTNENKFDDGLTKDFSTLNLNRVPRIINNNNIANTKKKMCNPTSMLHISNITVDGQVDAQALLDSFSPFGKIIGIKTFEHNEKQMALVKFEDVNNAATALCCLHNTPLIGSSTPLRISFSTNTL